MKKLFLLRVLLFIVNLTFPADAQETRIYYLGNSLTDELKYGQFVKLAEAGGKKIVWGRQMCPGIPIHGLYGMKEGGGFVEQPFGAWGKALSEFEWDAMTLQPFGALFEPQMQAAYHFASELAKKSPDATVFVYAQWPGRSGRGPMVHTDAVAWEQRFSGKCVPFDMNKKLSHEAPDWGLKDVEERFWYHKLVETLPPPLNETFKDRSLKHQYEAMVYSLNQANPGKKTVRLIPVGHVMQLLGQKMRAGLVPGYQTPWDFYTDGVHVNNDGSYLVACTFYATIFKRSPVGLPIGDYQGKPGWLGDHVLITPEFAKIVQETVWEVVATHPLTGVTTAEPLRIATPILEVGVAGVPYRSELLPAFGKSPYKWVMSGGSLPEGLTLSEQGVITGTPEKTGVPTVQIQVTDANGAKVSREFKLTVEQNTTPVIPAQTIAKQSVGKFFETRLCAEGGNGPIAWKLQKDAKLPPGLTLDGDGRLWGAPGKEGAYTFAVVATDADGSKTEGQLSMEVGPPIGDVAFARRLTEKLELCAWDKEPDMSPWKFRYPIKKLVQGEEATVEGAFDLAWDDNHLWIAVRVKDAANHPGQRTEVFQGDNIVFCLDMNNDRQATYNADDRFQAFARKCPWPLPNSIGDAFCGACRQRELEDGYFVLYVVNFRHFQWEKECLPNRALGLDIMLIDDAKDGLPKSMLVWQGSKDNATDPSQFGTVILKQEPQ